MPTLREKIRTLLEEYAQDARALSRALGIREKGIYPHLEHIRLSLKVRGQQLRITPYQCRLCGFEFKNRAKLHPPGRCPHCKQGSIEPALFEIRTSRGRGAKASSD